MGLVRIELTTSALSVLRSNRLSYSPRRPGWRTFEATPTPFSPCHTAAWLIRWPASTPPTMRARRPRDRRSPGGCHPRRTTAGSGPPAWPSRRRRRWGTGLAPLASTALLGSCHGRSTCTLTKTTRDAPPRIAIMLSKSVSVMGPFVPSPTMTSPPSWPSAFSVLQDRFTLGPLPADRGVHVDAGNRRLERVLVVEHHGVADGRHLAGIESRAGWTGRRRGGRRSGGRGRGRGVVGRTPPRGGATESKSRRSPARRRWRRPPGRRRSRRQP